MACRSAGFPPERALFLFEALCAMKKLNYCSREREREGTKATLNPLFLQTFNADVLRYKVFAKIFSVKLPLQGEREQWSLAISR